MGGIAKGKVEGGIESRLHALQTRKNELELEIDRLNFAMDQIGLVRDDVLVDEPEDDEQ